MDCPKCKITCPPDTVRCECGHIFKSDPSHYKKPVHISPTQEVTIKDIDMSFGNMIVFMVKWALASIPAMIIIAFVIIIIFVLAGGMLKGLLGVAGT